MLAYCSFVWPGEVSEVIIINKFDCSFLVISCFVEFAMNFNTWEPVTHVEFCLKSKQTDEYFKAYQYFLHSFFQLRDQMVPLPAIYRQLLELIGVNVDRKIYAPPIRSEGSIVLYVD